MAMKMRLKRIGTHKAPFYRIVVADVKSPRDGRFIDEVGTYNPLIAKDQVVLNKEKAEEWLKKGCLPTDTVRALLKKNGVL